MISGIKEILGGLRELVAVRGFTEVLGKGYRLLCREGFGVLWHIIFELKGIRYQEWVRRFDTLTDRDRTLIRQHIDRFTYHPMISVLMPVYNPPADFLRKAIESVHRQLYPHWELCIADDASSLPHVREILEESMRTDSRIRVAFRTENGHISRATNTALEMAVGEFIALLDHDDELAEQALYHVAAALDETPTLDLLYSDEDKIDAKGRRFDHYFKPNWNPDLFLAQNLVSHLGVYRRHAALEIGGFRAGFEGSQDWDFALRYIAIIPSSHIRHLPHVLYHWRAIAGSTAVSIDAKQYAVDAARRALEEFWRCKGREATVQSQGSGHFVTRLSLPDKPPKVSLVVCAGDRSVLLRRCIDGLRQHTDYPVMEILVVNNVHPKPEMLEYLATLKHEDGIRVIPMPGLFNMAALNNAAVVQATGEIVCFINNSVFPKTDGWLREMVAHALRPEIGAVGAKLLYPDGKIQHAGVLLNGFTAGFLYQGYPGRSRGYGNRAQLPQNLSAVSAACLVIRKTIWQEVDGMDEGFAFTFHDVDLCLRVQARGYRNLWLPQAELVDHASDTYSREDPSGKQTGFVHEVARLQKYWGGLLANDPHWNPNLALDGQRIGLAVPPRIGKPWLDVNS